MFYLTLIFHSTVRYFVLIAMLISIFRSARGWFGGAEFGKTDEKLSVWLLIMAHTQLILGLLLYALSPNVQFSASTMGEKVLRYWTVEHIFTMILAIVLITLSRITSKKIAAAAGKHKRVFLYNTFAMLLIVMAIQMSGRGFFGITM